MTASPLVFRRAIVASAENAEQLLSDVQILREGDRHSSAYVLAIAAQEECAKAFLLHLVDKKAIPWHLLIRRAMKDHACKQLLGLVMGHISPEWDEWSRRMDELLRSDPATRGTRGDTFPPTVADAINILRHEKIGRWESSSWFWDEEPDYDPTAERVSAGSRDHRKQDALYVRLTKDGSVASTPVCISEEEAATAAERATRFVELARELARGNTSGLFDYDQIIESFRLMFDGLK